MSLWLWISHHNWPWTLGIIILISSLHSSLGINGDQIKHGEESAGNSRGYWWVTIITSPWLVTAKDYCWLKKKMHDVKAVSYILFRASQGLWLKRQPLVFRLFCSRDGGAKISFLHHLLHCTIGLMLWRIFPLERLDICHFEKLGAEHSLPGG